MTSTSLRGVHKEIDGWAREFLGYIYYLEHAIFVHRSVAYILKPISFDFYPEMLWSGHLQQYS